MTEKGANRPPVRQEVMDRAAKYLAYKPRTRQELCRHLVDRGYSQQDAQACADQLEEYHLLDDLAYSMTYIETMLERGRGMNRIRRELQQKGVDSFVIEDAIAEMEEIPDEQETALKLAMTFLEGEDLTDLDRQQKEKIKGRLARRLASRGFRTDTVYRAVRAAFEKICEEQ